MSSERGAECVIVKGTVGLLVENGFVERQRCIAYDWFGTIFINQPGTNRAVEIGAQDLPAYLSGQNDLDGPNRHELERWFDQCHEVVPLLMEANAIARQAADYFRVGSGDSVAPLMDMLTDISGQVGEDRFVEASLVYAFNETDPTRLALLRSILGR